MKLNCFRKPVWEASLIVPKNYDYEGAEPLFLFRFLIATNLITNPIWRAESPLRRTAFDIGFPDGEMGYFIGHAAGWKLFSPLSGSKCLYEAPWTSDEQVEPSTTGGVIVRSDYGDVLLRLNRPSRFRATRSEDVADFLDLVQTKLIMLDDLHRYQKSPKLIKLGGTKIVQLMGRYLGGYGFDNVLTSRQALLTFTNRGLFLNEEFISWSNFRDISITGPGTYQTGGGWWGGGFGIKGALEGAAFAGIMNALTTRTKTETYIRIICEDAELNFLTSALDTKELDIVLSPLRALLTRENRGSETPHKREKSVRYCTNCGEARSEGHSFCASCGSKF